MLYEMRLPPGVSEKDLAAIVANYEVELKHSDYGPVIFGEEKELEKIRDFLVKSLNERLQKFEKK